MTTDQTVQCLRRPKPPKWQPVLRNPGCQRGAMPHWLRHQRTGVPADTAIQYSHSRAARVARVNCSPSAGYSLGSTALDDFVHFETRHCTS
jgi:hypothetical protein